MAWAMAVAATTTIRTVGTRGPSRRPTRSATNATSAAANAPGDQEAGVARASQAPTRSRPPPPVVPSTVGTCEAAISTAAPRVNPRRTGPDIA